MRLLPAFLPLLAFLFMTRRFARVANDPRDALLGAAVCWGLTTAVLTESLGACHRLAFPGLAIGWGLACLLAWPGPGPVRWTRPISGLPADWRAAGAGLAVIAVVTGAIAATSPPNTWDAMTYHLPRVMTWIQQGSVAHFPTATERQVHHAPWAEYALLQFQVLTGTDRLANLVQWFATVVGVTGVSRLAAALGGGPPAQVFAAVFAGTLPMGILQSTSTQTDAVTACWLVCAVHFGFAAAEGRGGPAALRSPWLVGAAFGLAALTKATGALYAGPFAAWLLVRRARGPRPGRWRAPALALGLAAAINVPHALRNIAVFGAVHPAQGDESGRFGTLNESFTLRILASNALRNAGLQLAAPVPRINRLTERAIRALHGWIGADPDDPRATLEAASFRLERHVFHEDYAGNPAHALLLMGLLLAAWARGLLRRGPVQPGYLLSLAAGAAGFFLLLKWQPWHGRLHLPWLVLSAPVAGCLATALLGRRPLRTLAMFLLLAALPWCLLNRNHPVLGGDSLLTTSRPGQIFIRRPDLLEPYRETARYIERSGARRIGLVSRHDGADDWEYPLWLLLGEPAGGSRRIEHVGVTNATRVLRDAGAAHAAAPDLIVGLSPGLPRRLDVDGRRYRRVHAAGPLGVYLGATTP